MSENEEENIFKISHSARNTFIQCHKKYYYNYIEKRPKGRWDHLDLGNVCHSALEVFHDTLRFIKNQSAEDLLNNIMSYAFYSARKEHSDVSNTIFLEAKKILGEYLNNIKRDGLPHVIGAEIKINLDIDLEKYKNICDRNKENGLK